ncbi:MAG: PDZ domain-containing protein, partial [Pedobacter sp.]
WIDGINFNDEIIAIDGAAVAGLLDRMNNITLANKNVGDVIKVSIKRDGLARDINVTLTARSTVRLTTSIKADATPKQQAVLKKWMGI